MIDHRNILQRIEKAFLTMYADERSHPVRIWLSPLDHLAARATAYHRTGVNLMVIHKINGLPVNLDNFRQPSRIVDHCGRVIKI